MSEPSRLNAAGELRERALAWWASKFPEATTPERVYVKGDGYIRFETDDGPYHVRICDLY